MKRNAIGAAILLLLARNVLGQEPPPLTVETLKPVPTVVKSGEPFVVVYRVKFPDLIGEGRELVVLEDRMVPENLSVDPFDASSVAVVKRRVGDEHIWDFAYTFRMLNPTKRTYVLPRVRFFWLVRDLGETIEDADAQLIDSDELYVSYVTTVTEDPVIDVRDTVELGSFRTRATIMKAIAWTIAPLPLVVWLVLFVRLMRRPRLARQDPLKGEDDLEALEVYLEPAAGQTRRQLARQLKVLGAMDHQSPPGNGQAWLALERSLVISLKDLLRAELPELNPGDTPKDIKAHIERSVKSGTRKDALMTLASKMVVYQGGLEQGKPAPVEDAEMEARRLQRSLRQLRPLVRVSTSLADWVDRRRGAQLGGDG